MYKEMAIVIGTLIGGLSSFAIAIISYKLLRQLKLTKEQIQLTREQMNNYNDWNKLNATFTFFSYKDFMDVEQNINNILKKISLENIDKIDIIHTDDVDKIYSSTDLNTNVKNFLNFYEHYATAVNIRAIDFDCAYCLASWKMIHVYHVFKMFIEKLRKEHDDPEIYIEIEKLALNWEKRLIETREKEKQAIAKLKSALDEAKGIQPKIE